MTYKILTINPGSTSTKIAVFENETKLFETNIKHSSEELAPYNSITDQFEFRKHKILDTLKANGQEINSINSIVGRGGLVKPIPSGVYEVNEDLLYDLLHPTMGEHASNLGGLIANDIAKSLKDVKAYIADPVVVDELEDIARISGHPLFKRVSIFHALNQKAIARRYAKEENKKYEDSNLIVVHLGGGISVGAHKKGKVIDVNNALNGEGPFSPERSGTLPVEQLATLCFSGKYTLNQVKKMIKGEGGFIAYLGTNDAWEVEKKSAIDPHFQFISDAMAYQVAKEIGAMAVVLDGNVDAILLTGGIAHNKQFCNFIYEKVKFISPIFKVYPGEDEMEALALNGLMILNKEIEPKTYKK
jgi:butyrate kinase